MGAQGPQVAALCYLAPRLVHYPTIFQMRKLFLTLWLAVASLTLRAQQPVDFTAFPPVDTEYVVDVFDASAHFAPPSAGGNAFWNYNTINLPAMGLDTLRFHSPTGQPGASAFPSATHAVPTPLVFNIGIVFEVPITLYWNVNADAAVSLGHHLPLSDFSSFGLPVVFPAQEQVFSPEDTLYTFPLAMGNSFSSGTMKQTVFGTFFGIYPVKVERTYTRSYTVDDWGDLLLPSSDTLYALRVVTHLHYNDTAYIDSTGSWEVVTSIAPVETFDTLYSYYNPVHGEVMRLSRTEQITDQGPSSYGILWYRLGLPAPEPASSREALASPAFRLAPNPASGMVRLVGAYGLVPTAVTVCNTQGQVLMRVDGSDTLNVGQLPAGLYVVRAVYANGSVATQRLVVR